MSGISPEELERLRYPIGRFEARIYLNAEERKQDIQTTGRLADDLGRAVLPLTLLQLDTPYREGGWSVRQVVHHLADTGMYAYLRFKKGLTEETPQIPSYRQDLWAEQSDYLEEPLESSLQLMDSLNRRFVTLLNSMAEPDFERCFVSAGLGELSLDAALQRYIWHNKHHIAQIASLIQRNGW
ncbi:YfiT family bacillithiol transferase [Paenibacillus sp. FSL R7-0331]|uniref:YfiT family bacillithiol transferase n=1 Tax=Paenibacillus sp. FSL R7-0331 TaxID=1536773 RepID=UPI0004F7C82B|nr:putative metal-dependent hydrolase [Paenibacillus sp. FSL R7-0331]AIQ52211.1 metal-dependent hydrolase [Paenibacillus sp. FSL R7-0331]